MHKFYISTATKTISMCVSSYLGGIVSNISEATPVAKKLEIRVACA